MSVIDPNNEMTSINDAIASKFSNMNSDAKCAIVFNDAVYMNDGTVKVDDEYVTITGNSSMSSVESFNYEMFSS